MSFTMESVYQILDIMKASKNCSLTFDAGDVTISIAKGNVAAPAAATIPADAIPCAAAPAAATVSADAVPCSADDVNEVGLVPIKANVTSVFYRKPNPEEPPFVEVGDEVEEDTVVCLLEVMKCFRQVTADVKGRIAKILVDSGELVETGSVMFLVEPL